MNLSSSLLLSGIGLRPNAAKQKGQVVEKSAVQMNFWVN
jgi:hypothetical protein